MPIEVSSREEEMEGSVDIPASTVLLNSIEVGLQIPGERGDTSTSVTEGVEMMGADPAPFVGLCQDIEEMTN